MFFLLSIITLIFAIITWRDVHQGLWILIALLPSYLLRTEIFGVPTTLLEMMIVTFVVVWTVKKLSSREPARPNSRSGMLQSTCNFHLALWHRLKPSTANFTLLIISILIISAIAIFVSPNTTAALGVWKAYFLEPIVLFFIVRYELTRTSVNHAKQTPPNPPLLRGGDELFSALGVCALFLSIIAIVQWITGAGIPIPWDIEHRVTSVFDYPNALGLFLGPITVIAFLKISPLTKGGLRGVCKEYLFWPSVFFLSFLAIILAQSEAAIVAVLATLAIAGLFNRKTRRATVVAIITSALLIVISPCRGLIFDKLTLQDYSGQVRLTQWSETLDMLGDHWLLGAGLAGYPTVFAPYHKATHIEIFQYPHNIFLNAWVELGLMGLIGFTLLLILMFRSFFSSFPLLPTIYYLLPFLALLEIFIHGLVDVPYFKNDLAVLTWLMLAITSAYAVQTVQTKTQNQPS